MFFGDTLTNDGHWDKSFDYGLANPPFGVEWKKQEAEVNKEHENRGFNGRRPVVLDQLDHQKCIRLGSARRCYCIHQHCKLDNFFNPIEPHYFGNVG
jgi:hypothetical protein